MSLTYAHRCLQSLKKAMINKIQIEMIPLTEIKKRKKSSKNRSVMTLATTIPSKTLTVSISIHQEVVIIVVNLIQLNHLRSIRTNTVPLPQKLRIKIERMKICVTYANTYKIRTLNTYLNREDYKNRKLKS